MKKLMLAVLFACATVAVPSTPWAQAYPVKPIRLVVPYAPGGATDPIARMVGQMVGDVLGQPFVVENRGGAGGIIGEEMVARAAPDGYTLLIATASTHVAPTFLSKNVPFDPVKDFTPIAAAVEPVLCLVVNTSIPATSVRQLADYGKNNPGKLTYGSAGIGTSNHLHGVLFGQTAGVDVVHVPYKGSGPVITDMISGQIAMAFIPLVAVSQQVRSGKLRLIATLPAKRYPGTPDTPAIGETLPGFEQMPSWMGFLGPAGLPRPMTTRLNAEIVKAVNSAEVRAKLDATGFAIITNSPEEFAAQIRGSLDLYGRIVKAAGVQPE